MADVDAKDRAAHRDGAARLHHLGFVVPLMAPAIERFAAEGAQVVIAATSDPLQGVYCALLHCTDGTDIELVAPIDPEKSPIRSRLQRGGGLDHICYWVDDLDHRLKAERALGAVVIRPPTYAVTFNATVAFVQRRSGLLIELMGAASKQDK